MQIIKKEVLFLLLLIWFPAIKTEAQFATGCDISFYNQHLNLHTQFFKNSVQMPLPEIVKSYGVGVIRLRVWNNPTDGYCSLDSTIKVMKLLNNYNFTFMIDLHYSDTWSDPGQQTKPSLWQACTDSALKDSVYSFTSLVLNRIKNEGLSVKYIQIGNEITSGMLWPTGRVGGSYETAAQWKNLTDLLKAGISAVQDFNQQGNSVKTLIHLSEGGNYSTCKWFFDKLEQYSVNYDIIGLSYYPFWHGDLSALASNINGLINRYNKELFIVETAYPFTLGWKDNCNNFVGSESQLLSGYSATVEGQKSFLQSLITTIKNNAGNYGLGVIYWEPDYVAVSGFCSPYENLALFDFNNNALNSFSALDVSNSIQEVKNVEVSNKLVLYPSIAIDYLQVKLPSWVNRYRVYDVVGNLILNNQSANSYNSLIHLNLREIIGTTGVYFFVAEGIEKKECTKFIYIK